MNDPLMQGSKGPTLFPDMHDPFDPHHPRKFSFEMNSIINKLKLIIK